MFVVLGSASGRRLSSADCAHFLSHAALFHAILQGVTLAPTAGMLAEHPLNGLTSRILQCAIEVHRHLGPGLLESAYSSCLSYELGAAGLSIQSGVRVPLRYKTVYIDCSYELDLIVNEAVIVELKSVARVDWVHKAQLLTYLRLTGSPIGLLINFNVPVLKDGVSRLLNTRSGSGTPAGEKS